MQNHFCERTGKSCYGDSELPLLFEISQLINNSKFLKDAMNPIMELIATYLGAERSLLSILNREVSNIFIEFGYGITSDEKKSGKYLIGEGVTGEVVKTGKPMYVEKINQARGFVNKTGINLKTRKQEDISFVCVPITVDGEILGTLSITRVYDDRILKEELIRILSVVGSMIARAVQNRQDRMEEIERLRSENIQLHNELKNRYIDENIVGNSAKMREVSTQIQQVAKTQATVLIRGESGVGKELITDAIHYGSPRAKAP